MIFIWCSYCFDRYFSLNVQQIEFINQSESYLYTETMVYDCNILYIFVEGIILTEYSTVTVLYFLIHDYTCNQH